jgi:hypothetical protein
MERQAKAGVVAGRDLEEARRTVEVAAAARSAARAQ